MFNLNAKEVSIMPDFCRFLGANYVTNIELGNGD
jgi:hypothetical protein